MLSASPSALGDRLAQGHRRKTERHHLQFLLEAMTLTGAGGVIALILVNGLVFLIRATLKWQGIVPAWAAILGVSVSVRLA